MLMSEGEFGFVGEMKQGLCVVGAIHESPGMCELCGQFMNCPYITISFHQFDKSKFESDN